MDDSTDPFSDHAVNTSLAMAFSRLREAEEYLDNAAHIAQILTVRWLDLDAADRQKTPLRWHHREMQQQLRNLRTIIGMFPMLSTKY